MTILVGGFNPFEKYDRQIGSNFCKVRGENEPHISKHHLAISLFNHNFFL